METFAYLQVASMYENPNHGAGLWERPQGRNPSYRVRAGLAAATLTLSMLGMATNAFAALQVGDSGTEVTNLQTALQAVGYFQGPITGFYGPLTEEAVRRYQADNQLGVDGKAGPVTLSRLENAPRGGTTIQTASISTPSPTPSGVLKLGATGAEVEALQNRLRDIGFFSGPTSGVFGPITDESVKRFQADQGLTADGVVGPATLTALQNYRSGNSAVTAAPQSIGGPAVQTTDSNNLRLNSTGPAVERLQTNLKTLGLFNNAITGFYGPMTEEAVRRFQASNDLESDGIAGPVTQRAAQSAADAVSRNGNGGSSSSTNVSNPPQFSVLELQTRLWQRGFYKGALDGQMGPQTRASIEAAQRFYQVSSTDITAGRF